MVFSSLIFITIFLPLCLGAYFVIPALLRLPDESTLGKDELGQMHAKEGEPEYSHIPDWYKWERECVKEEVIEGTYSLDADVEIGMIVDFKSLYMVGTGHLHHDVKGFTLKGCDGQLDYSQGALTCYSLYADYYWYEIGDIICIGDKECLYYCFVKPGVNVAKARIATEEIFKHIKEQRKTDAM